MQKQTQQKIIYSIQADQSEENNINLPIIESIVMLQTQQDQIPNQNSIQLQFEETEANFFIEDIENNNNSDQQLMIERSSSQQQEKVVSTYKIKYFKQQIKEEWELMSESPEVTDLKLYQDNYKKSQILKKLAFNTRFPNIKQLSIACNNIESLEPIQFMFMPCLQVMNIQQNCISYFKSLRKANIPNIFQIKVKSNVINSATSDIFDQLSQGCFPNLKSFNFNESYMRLIEILNHNINKESLKKQFKLKTKIRKIAFKKFQSINI